MKTTRYTFASPIPHLRFKAAIVADLHDHPYKEILPILERERPDLILIPGDLTEWLKGGVRTPHPGLGLLERCAAIAPTFYSLGNHEIGAHHGRIYKSKLAGEEEIPPYVLPARWKQTIAESGATLLDNGYVTWTGQGGIPLVIGGMGSGLLNPGHKPDMAWLEDFSSAEGYKLLLCHHPEYFDRYLRPYPIHMIVSGHAHGGQWRVFGRGVYAPDQHLFPKYTSGVHEGRLVISRGVANTVSPIPRFFNRREVVVVSVGE
jgi:predicted MPP superfamily phosphohydrolase